MNNWHDKYIQYVWDGSTTVGFGISSEGKFVVAWFCKTKDNDPYKTNDFKKNVKKDCLKDGYNTYFNDIKMKNDLLM